MNAAQPLQSPSSQTPPTPQKKGNGLAITALVLAALFFLPFIPTIGLVLGIIALATGRSKTMSIVAICLGGFFTLTMGVYVAVAIPAFMKYIRRAKTVEATANVRALADGIAALGPQQWAQLADGDWTPAGSACGQPLGKFPPQPAAWQGEPWKSLGFALDTAHYYQYRVARDGGGFVVEARGDLDCDGVFSRFVRHVTPDGVGPLQSENEIE